MAITVADLLDMPHLRLHLHAGRSGLGRDVSWTHTSDLPDPWRWLAGGELLLTNGMSFPADGQAQREVIERLVEAGAAALAIGERMYCPPLTRELAEAGDELGFSILTVEYPTPFVGISRAVAVANLLEQSDRLIRTERIYHAMHRMISSQGESSALSEALSPLLGCRVRVCHRESGEPWYPEDPRPDPALAEALREAADSSDLRAGAFAHPLPDGRELRLVGIPTEPSAVLVLESDGHQVLDALLTQHAVVVIALELSQSLMNVEHRRRNGAELLAQFLEHRADPRSGARQLKSHGLRVTSASLLAITSVDITRLRNLHVALWRSKIAHLVVHRSGVLYLLGQDDKTLHAVIRSNLGEEAAVGVSAPIGTVERIQEAAREAGWAVRAAAGLSSRTFRYGDASPVVGIAGIDDAVALVTRVLGPVDEHEQRHGTDLLHTLETFLRHQRSWQKTAEALHVHRQTVLYRIRKVEELTGHDLDETADIAELWLALQARAMLHPRGGDR
jgi:PucR family transcriptional regulator, purine catabolism regulatory protein